MEQNLTWHIYLYVDDLEHGRGITTLTRPLQAMEPGELAVRFGSTSNHSRDRIEVGRFNEIVRKNVTGRRAPSYYSRMISRMNVSYRYVSLNILNLVFAFG